MGTIVDLVDIHVFQFRKEEFAKLAMISGALVVSGIV